VPGEQAPRYAGALPSVRRVVRRDTRGRRTVRGAAVRLDADRDVDERGSGAVAGTSSSASAASGMRASSRFVIMLLPFLCGPGRLVDPA
jgi:hypothetical protein